MAKATREEAEQAIRDGVRELFEEMLGMLSADDADRAAGRERMEAGMERTMRAFGKDVDWDGLTSEMDAEQIKAATKIVLRDEAIRTIAPMRPS